MSPTKASGSTGTRPLRADAQRNRQRLLEVAVRAFTEDGPDVPLDAIAKEAGVGIGTLYRHFPEADTERVGSIRRLGTKAQIRGQYCGGFA